MVSTEWTVYKEVYVWALPKLLCCALGQNILLSQSHLTQAYYTHGDLNIPGRFMPQEPS